MMGSNWTICAEPRQIFVDGLGSGHGVLPENVLNHGNHAFFGILATLCFSGTIRVPESSPRSRNLDDFIINLAICRHTLSLRKHSGS